ASKLILAPQANDKLSLLSLSGNYSLLIGPEGGFEEQEIAWALAKGFQNVCLGKQILRTATAPIAAIAAIYPLEKVFYIDSFHEQEFCFIARRKRTQRRSLCGIND